jgi:HSP20 family protein
MSLVRKNDMFPNFFDDFFTRDFMNWGLSNNSNTNTTIPAVNIKETNDNFEVEMAAPGMTKMIFVLSLMAIN